jgi:hypothetical protein
VTANALRRMIDFVGDMLTFRARLGLRRVERMRLVTGIGCMSPSISDLLLLLLSLPGRIERVTRRSLRRIPCTPRSMRSGTEKRGQTFVVPRG